MSYLFRSAGRFRRLLSLYPPYLGTGVSVRDVSPDFKRVEVVMKQRFYNRNAYGTHFGGSLYSMCDPFYALMLQPLLGSDYLIWDRGACIDYRKPGRGTVTAVFQWSDEQLEEIRARTAGGDKFEPERVLDITDAEGDCVARVQKTIYVRQKPRVREDSRRPK